MQVSAGSFCRYSSWHPLNVYGMVLKRAVSAICMHIIGNNMRFSDLALPLMLWISGTFYENYCHQFSPRTIVIIFWINIVLIPVRHTSWLTGYITFTFCTWSDCFCSWNIHADVDAQVTERLISTTGNKKRCRNASSWRRNSRRCWLEKLFYFTFTWKKTAVSDYNNSPIQRNAWYFTCAKKTDG